MSPARNTVTMAAARSAKSRGATPSAAPSRPSRNSLAVQLPPRNVLVVEDEQVLADWMVQGLKRVGLNTTAVGDASAALVRIGQEPFDAVVCDVILPGIEGTALYEHLLEHYPDLAAHVVFVTGWMKDSKVHRLLDHTGRPVLSKPFKISELIAVVGSLVVGGEAAVTA